MAQITLNSEDFTDEQFENITNLIKSYNNENKDICNIAALAYAKSRTSDEKSSKVIQESFKAGSEWRKGLLTDEEYFRIVYVILASFSTADYNDETKAEAMKFINKLCKVFNVDKQRLVQ